MVGPTYDIFTDLLILCGYPQGDIHITPNGGLLGNR